MEYNYGQNNAIKRQQSNATNKWHITPTTCIAALAFAEHTGFRKLRCFGLNPDILNICRLFHTDFRQISSQ